ncbi:hypothetical protein [Streptomyces sp. NPDC048663]|uniref:hypothetical protein n=1 Tax=Streptomyces sp. NPDC048663 TaxID=3155638 RepID=UPI003424420C
MTAFHSNDGFSGSPAPQSMKRWVLPADVTEAAGLFMEEVPVPVPGPGEVRIRVRAISTNYRDHLILKGPSDGCPSAISFRCRTSQAR